MSDPFEYLHETIRVGFEYFAARPLGEIHALAQQAGFVLVDDLLDLPRVGVEEKWQSPSIVAMDCYSRAGSVELYDDADLCDQVEAKIFLASIPLEEAILSVKPIRRFAELLDVHLMLESFPATADDILKRIRAEALELTSLGMPPGSEAVAITIESTYPR